MEKILDLTAAALAKVTHTAAIAGAQALSRKGAYQPETPKALLK